MKLTHTLLFRLATFSIGAALSLGTLGAKDKKDDDHHKKDDRSEHHSSSGHGDSHSSHHDAPKVVHHSDSKSHDSGRTRHDAPKIVHHDDHKSGDGGRSHHEAPKIVHHDAPKVIHHDAPPRIAESHHVDHKDIHHDVKKSEHHVDISPRTAHAGPRVVEHIASHSDRDRRIVVNHSKSPNHHPGHVEHNVHHSVDWYRSNGWHHDDDYWHHQHHHRFFDDDGCVIFEDSVEPYYAIGFDPIPQARVYINPERDYYADGFDYETRVAVQEELARAGYYDGDIDGIIGPETRRAIADFQSNHGLRPTGYINRELLDELGI